jgi:hypothetical protein
MKLVALLGVCALACGSQTQVVVAVESDFDVPMEVNRLAFAYRTDPGGAWKEQSSFRLLKPGQAGDMGEPVTTLPARFGLLDPDSDTKRIEVRVELLSNDIVVASRDATFDFVPRTVRIRLDHDCAHALCPDGKTCVPGLGCKRPDLDGRDAPREPNGPPCRCENFFPVCVGARWSYAECSPAHPECPRKTWVISDYTTIGSQSAEPELDRTYGKEQTWAFVQVRKAGTDDSQRWISVVPERDQVFWEKSKWFDRGWRPLHVEYQIPQRIRFDGTHLSPMQPWDMIESKAVDWLDKGEHPDSELRQLDEWTVVTPDSLPLPVRNHLDEFTQFKIVCHRRLGRFISPDGAEKTNDKTFCFGRGVGKVVEFTAPDMYELLYAWDVPSRTGRCSQGSVSGF